ncbi:efflux RND transporter periplasmic adaptor subunit [Candidatus Roizmanbacteria bacterium]|nr:efflux RND transporter periplasmic adaptor subunit [Candidatus Roizmanbacteria bacterium]
MMKIFRKRWYVVTIILLVIGLFFLKVKSAPANGKNGKKQVSYMVKRQNLKETLSLSGSIDAEEHVTLRFQSSGRLLWVGVKEGDYVKKYQGIASLDQRELKKTLEKYLNTFVKKRFDLDQSVDDNWQKQYDLSQLIREKAERTLKSSQYDLNNAVLDVELQSLSVEFVNLWTPIEGVVTKVGSPFAGVNITPSQAEFEIINPKTVFFSATADQSDVVKISEGLLGKITLDAFPDDKINAVVKDISFVPKSGETGTVYEVKVNMLGSYSDFRYRFGMTGDASFTVREIKNTLFVPTKYVKTEKKPDGTLIREYVLKKVNGNQEKTTIEIGENVDEYTIITSGLKEGDTVYD